MLVTLVINVQVIFTMNNWSSVSKDRTTNLTLKHSSKFIQLFFILLVCHIIASYLQTFSYHQIESIVREHHYAECCCENKECRHQIQRHGSLSGWLTLNQGKEEEPETNLNFVGQLFL